MNEMQAVAQTAQALSDETRLCLLMILRDGDATVNDLAAHLDLAQPRVSSHLALLRRAGLVSATTVGRQRTYHVDAARITQILSMLGDTMQTSTHPPRSPQATRIVQREMPIRQARTCYDHLAGVAGVQLLDALLQRGWITEADARYQLTPEGDSALRARGVDLDAARRARRKYAFGCLDWTERRPHLGGALGAVIFHALEDGGVVRRDGATRTMVLAQPISDWLNG
jgi:DNA-binding transcriptional ArsR family regulator